MPLFRRAYRLIIGEQGLVSGRVITDLQLKFKITKSSDDTQNKAEIEIFNLSKETLAQFDDSDDDDTNNPVVILQTKYEEDVGNTFHTLYTGNVTDTFTTKEGPDLITKLTCSDGYVPVREARIARNFPAGTTRRIVLDALIEVLDVPVGEIRDGGRLDELFTNGTTYEGPVKLALDSLLDAVNIDWSIQDDSFHAIRRDLASEESVLDLNSGYREGEPNTGLIGSPNRSKGRKGKLKDQENELNEGVTIETLLEPGLRPNRRVRVTSREFENALFKVNKVVHRGDFRGKDWTSKADLIAYDISF